MAGAPGNLCRLLRVNARADGQSIRAHRDCAAHAQHVNELLARLTVTVSDGEIMSSYI